MVFSICTMHFTGVSAIEIQLDPRTIVPPRAISDTMLGLSVMAVMGVIFVIGFASVSIESSLEHEARAQLKHAARHDPLTGLPNRLGLTQKMTEISMLLETDEVAKVGILTIDLNLFKEVNDLYGHASGDTVLIAVAERLSTALEGGEFVARSGGDEFVAIKTGFRRVEEVTAFGERLSAVILEPIVIGDLSTSISAAVGVATNINDGRVVHELQHKSDLAMYRAKAEPELRVCVYNAEMDKQSQDRL